MGRQHLAVSKSGPFVVVLQVFLSNLSAGMRPWLILLAVVLVTLEIAEGLPKPKWYLVDTEEGHGKGRADKGDCYQEVAKSYGEDYGEDYSLSLFDHKLIDPKNIISTVYGEDTPDENNTVLTTELSVQTTTTFNTPDENNTVLTTGSELLNMVDMIVRKLLERWGPYINGVELSPDEINKVVDEAHKNFKEAIHDGETSMRMTTFTALKQDPDKVMKLEALREKGRNDSILLAKKLNQDPAKLMEIMNDIQQEVQQDLFRLVVDAPGDYGNDYFVCGGFCIAVAAAIVGGAVSGTVSGIIGWLANLG